MDQQDLVVIGGGTSGYIVATGALRMGLKVALIERSQNLGGSALHYGCIPSKALLHVAQIAHTVRNAGSSGLESSLLPINITNVQHNIHQMISTLNQQQDQEAQYIFKQLGGEIIYGEAKFRDAHTLAINNRLLKSKKFVIATGSRPVTPAIQGLDQTGYITTDSVFNLNKLPEKLLILGGDHIALEFAQAFVRLGAKVAVFLREDSILPAEDPEIVAKLQDALIQEGIEFFCNTQIQKIYMQKDHKVLECFHASGAKFSEMGSDILVVMDRTPCVEGLGLENTGIKYDAEGIIVNRKLKTSLRHIYALGDVIRGSSKLTHAAEYQANIVLSNLIFRLPARVKFLGFPYVIFTQPEYAHVGLSEQQAKKLGFNKLEITRFDFKDLDSSVLQNVLHGAIKVVSYKGKIIGATILGPQASNLIAEWGLALNLGARVADIATTIHAYPTLAQINKRVANKYIAKGLFSIKNRRWVSYLQRIMVWG